MRLYQYGLMRPSSTHASVHTRELDRTPTVPLHHTSSPDNMEENTATIRPSEDDLVCKKKNTVSCIWRWFGFKRSDEQQNQAICKECHKTIVSKSGSTSNLFHHLQRHLKVQYDECLKLRDLSATTSATKTKQPEKFSVPKQSSLEASFTRSVSQSSRWCDITKAVAFHIAKDMVPVATVEQDGFKTLLKTIDPRYQLTSRKYFSTKALPEMYTEVRRKLSDQLGKVTHFALTTDIWLSRTCEPYMSLTIHFIEDWEMKTACLQTSYFPQDHTGEHIAEALQDALTNWKLNEKGLVAITTDNGSNVIKAVELQKWLRMQCFGQRLHLTIGHGMNDNRITRAISLCKKVVSSFSYSWKKRRELAEVQIQLGLPAHH